MGKRWTPIKDAFHPLEHINSFSYKSLCKLAKEYNLRPLKPSQIYDNLFSIIKAKTKFLLTVPSWYFQKIN